MDNLNMQCNNCEAVFELTADSLKDHKVVIESICLTAKVHTCPMCKEKTLVQLDNSKTLTLLNEYKMLAVLRTRKRMKGTELKQKQLKHMYRLQKELDDTRKELNTQYWESATCSLMEKDLTGLAN